MPIEEELLTVPQLAAAFDCHPETIEAETRAGRLPGIKLGRSWRFPREALLRVLNQLAIDDMARRATPATTAPVAGAPQPRGRRRRVPPNLPPFPG